MSREPSPWIFAVVADFDGIVEAPRMVGELKTLVFKLIAILIHPQKILIVMKTLPAFLSLCCLAPALRAAEPAEDDQVGTVSIPSTVSNGTLPASAPPPEMPDFKIVESRAHLMDVVEPPPMPGLPPVTGRVNVTVRRVEDPKMNSRPEPLLAVQPDGPAVIAALAELRENHQGMELLFVSATVYDRSRTFLRIYPNGASEQRVAAWSNVDFNHFSGFSAFRVTRQDGSFTDYGLMMGIGNIDTASWEQFLEQQGREYEAPDIPELPDLAEAGPRYLVVEGGDSGSPSLATLAQVHQLYSTEGERIEAAYVERERNREEREAWYRANPPQPKDVTIHFWRTNRKEEAR